MNEREVRVLFEASQTAGLTPEQVQSLTLTNPFGQRGAIASKMQVAVSRIDPELAQTWIAEAGAQMSLMAMAAKQGLTEVTPELAAEIAAFTPKTPEQAKAEQIEELVAANPFGKAGYYKEDGSYVPPVPGDLTKALLLQSLAPEKAEAMRMAATPVQPSSAATESQKRATESQARADSRNHGQTLIKRGF